MSLYLLRSYRYIFKIQTFNVVATPQKGVVVNISYPGFLRLAVVLVGVLNCMYCANPVDEPPLEWRSQVVAPITNERFMVAEQMDSLFEFTKDVEVIKDDTLSFAVSRLDSAEYERTEKAFDTMYYRVTVGELKVKNIKDVDADVPYDTTGKVVVPIPVPLEGVRTIVMSTDAKNILNVTFSNSTNRDLDSVSIMIPNVGTETAGLVASGTTSVLQFDLREKMIQDTLKFIVTSYSSARATGTVGISCSLNGLVASSLEVLDSLVAFSQEFVNRYELTDTMDLDYVDIDRGSFVYTILNHCNVSFNLQCIHDHIWETNFCKLNDIEDVTDLSSLPPADSIHFNGGIPGARIMAGPNTEAQLQKVILSGSRLFPEWDDSLKKSVTNVRYTVEILSTGKYVTLTSLDSMMFTITTNEFTFEAMAGTVVEPIEYDVDTQKVAIELPWNTTVKDSLRGRFILSNVWGDLALQTRLGINSRVDTIDLSIYAFDPESTTVQDSMHTRFIALNNDSVYNRSIDITNVANQFSDSIALAVKMKIPVGTYVKFVTDTRNPLPPEIIGRMLVEAFTNFRLNARLDWRVDQLVNMDLGTSRFEVPEAMQYFGKMKERSAEFDLWVKNNSNLQISLFSLVAPATLMDTLDSLSMNEVYAYLKDNQMATDAGYINLFDTAGVIIPARDTTATEYNKVLLNDKQIDMLLGTDSLSFRWWIQFKEQDRDALKLTDFIDLKSRLGIRGTNNTDSLLIW